MVKTCQACLPEDSPHAQLLASDINLAVSVSLACTPSLPVSS